LLLVVLVVLRAGATPAWSLPAWGLGATLRGCVPAAWPTVTCRTWRAGVPAVVAVCGPGAEGWAAAGGEPASWPGLPLPVARIAAQVC